MAALCVILAVLSIWDYPSRHHQHELLRRQFVEAARAKRYAVMERASRQGCKLLPDDPTWCYNLACSLALLGRREKEAFDALEKAIDLGFRDVALISRDKDLKRLSRDRRYAELIEYAKMMQTRPLIVGPMVTIDATGVMGGQIALGEQNFGWDFTVGCFIAQLKLSETVAGGNAGDLYMNRDAEHSFVNVADFPGLTVVKLDESGRSRGLDLNAPNILFPYPTFGNCSRAFVSGKLWRSLPRSLMTVESRSLDRMVKFYLSNQTWVFPANADVAPVGTNGDVFASITPYWITTAGRSYSDLPYLRAALVASRAFATETKNEIVKRGLLAPTIQTLIRKSLRGVSDETDYLTPKAHPTAFPDGGVELPRLTAAAAAMKPTEIPPLAMLTVSKPLVTDAASRPELTYASAFAWAFVLRSEDEERVFFLQGKGAEEYAFVQTHGEGVDVKVERTAPDAAKVTLNRRGMSPTNRVDIAVFGRNKGTGWGAPSYVSFARMDASAPYSDPALTQVAATEK